MSEAMGKTRWAIPDGYIPSQGSGEAMSMADHASAWLLNTGEEATWVSLTAFFSDRGPAGPYTLRVPAQRTLHLHLAELDDPMPIPRDTAFSWLIEAEDRIIVHQIRHPLRQAESPLMHPVG